MKIEINDNNDVIQIKVESRRKVEFTHNLPLPKPGKPSDQFIKDRNIEEKDIYMMLKYIYNNHGLATIDGLCNSLDFDPMYVSYIIDNLIKIGKIILTDGKYSIVQIDTETTTRDLILKLFNDNPHIIYRTDEIKQILNLHTIDLKPILHRLAHHKKIKLHDNIDGPDLWSVKNA